MLEAKLEEAGVLKRLLDAIKELVTDANFECNEEGITLQAMDNSHVALVSVKFESTGFKRYRCDRPLPLGVNLTSLTKVLKCAKDDDECTLKANDEADVLNMVYEAKHSDRVAEYDIKLMDIDSDSLGIPKTYYDAQVLMPSSEFSRIVRDLSQLGESVRIEISKEGVRFVSEGESANGNVLLKPTGGGTVERVPRVEEDEEEKEETVVKKEDAEMKDATKDEEEEANEEYKASEEEGEGDDSDEEGSKKRKKRANGTKPNKKPKTGSSKTKKDEEPGEVKVFMNQHVSLTFSLKYLVNFSKSSSLCSKVELKMSNEVPLLVSYNFGQGRVDYYLAPKIGDE